MSFLRKSLNVCFKWRKNRNFFVWMMIFELKKVSDWSPDVSISTRHLRPCNKWLLQCSGPTPKVRTMSLESFCIRKGITKFFTKFRLLYGVNHHMPSSKTLLRLKKQHRTFLQNINAEKTNRIFKCVQTMFKHGNFIYW